MKRKQMLHLIVYVLLIDNRHLHFSDFLFGSIYFVDQYMCMNNKVLGI